MKDAKYPFISVFSSNLKPIVSSEKDKYLALASLKELKAFLPEIDLDKNHDLLPIAFNACVVNRVNKNDDVINTETALALYKNFINKQINIEHNRKNVVGVILAAGFSEFGTDVPLTEEQVKETKSPFNITLGGVIWRVVSDEIADFIEESNDPTSDKYQNISASWELGFSSYQIVLLDEGKKNIETGEIIANGKEIEKKYENLLRAYGGTGKTDDGKRVYRMATGGVTPLGIGLTTKPAADVKGIAVENVETKEEKEKVDATNNVDTSTEKNLSQAAISNVNTERQLIMKITSLQEITDESIKQMNASAVSEFISSELTKKSKEWETEKKSLETKVDEASASNKKLLTECEELKQSVKDLSATVQNLTKEKTEKEAVEKFNARMTEVNEAYTLDDEVRAAIVDEVKAIASDEDYAKWKKKASVLLKGFAKKKEDAKAAVQPTPTTVVDQAIDAGKKDSDTLPNTSSTTTQTLKERYQAAFAKENFVITK